MVLIRSAKGDWTAAFGSRTTAGGEAVTTADVFRLGDLSHTMTASVVLLLQQQGRLALTDPISKYVDGVPNGDRITLADLGTYDSGLANYTEDPVFAQAYAADPQRTWTPQELLQIAYARPLETPDLPDGVGQLLQHRLPAARAGHREGDGEAGGAGGQGAGHRTAAAGFDGPLGGRWRAPGPAPHGYVFAASPFGDPVLPPEQRAAVESGQQQPTDHSTDSMSWAGAAGGLYANAAERRPSSSR